MANTDLQGMTLSEKIVEGVAIANAALEKAAAAESAQREKQAAVTAMIPDAVDALIAHGRVGASQRDKLAAALKDPVEALRLLTKLAAHRSVEELARLGDGFNPAAAVTGNEKKAGASPFVGGHVSGMRESDRRLFAALNIPVTSE